MLPLRTEREALANSVRRWETPPVFKCPAVHFKSDGRDDSWKHTKQEVDMWKAYSASAISSYPCASGRALPRVEVVQLGCGDGESLKVRNMWITSGMIPCDIISGPRTADSTPSKQRRIYRRACVSTAYG